MRPLLIAALLLPGTWGFAAHAQDPVAAIRQAALQDDQAWSIVEGLTTEVGPRAAGGPAEARARDWAVARLTALGFVNVRVEPFTIPDRWVRGAESAEVVDPFPQRLVLTALGGSGATAAAGLTAEVIGFPGLGALRAADPAAVRGKIVYVGNQMAPSQDGSGYGAFGPVRWQGPGVAAQKGAAAIIIRSIGTDHHRLPHAGDTDWPAGIKPIPAAALAVPDGEQLERILARGRPVRVKLVLTPQRVGPQPSGNVIAEIPGRDPSLPIIVIGGHLDSWDLGSGAIDDGAGAAITAAAARQVMTAGQPLRTIRLVWFGSEEIGGLGGVAYQKAHGSEAHALAAEADFGADRVWRFEARTAAVAKPIVDSMAAALLPLGIARGETASHAGTDVAPLTARGTAFFALEQDGTRYFDIHHTADDTLDKIDRVQLRQAVAAYATVLAIAANSPAAFGPVTPSPPEDH